MQTSPDAIVFSLLDGRVVQIRLIFPYSGPSSSNTIVFTLLEPE